ncbi:MAG: MTH938/NDUFAF3 family protein [Ktedonobacteraceae bacterium]
MKPHLDQTTFGSITIDGTTFAHDVLIRLNGRIKKRKKKLSKAVYGTSHVVSLAEAKHVYEPGAQRLILGTGQQDQVRLSDEAVAYFQRKQCQVELLPTPQALAVWNTCSEAVIGLFHVTC